MHLPLSTYLPPPPSITHSHSNRRQKTRIITPTRTSPTIPRQLITNPRIPITSRAILLPRLSQAFVDLTIAAIIATLARGRIIEVRDRAAEAAGTDDAGERGSGQRRRGGSRGRGGCGRSSRCGDGCRRCCRRADGWGHGAATSRRAVPVRDWVLETLAGSDTLPALGFDEVEVVRCQVRDTLLVDIVLDAEEVATRGSAIDSGFDNILADLDVGGECVQVVLGVEIEVDAVVAELLHVGLAAGGAAALRVGRAHIGWVFSDDVGEGALVVGHLLDALGGPDRVQ